MGGKTSKSNSSSSSNQQDQRIVAGEGAFVVGPGSTSAFTSNTDNSLKVQTSSNSTNSGNTTVNTSDPGAIAAAVKLGQQNTEFLKAAAGSQSDAAKFIAQMGGKAVADMGESLTDLYSTAGKNNTQTWSATLSASENLMDKMLQTAASTSDGAKAVAQAAIASYQPADSKMGDAFKYAAIAAAVAVAWGVMRK